MKPAARREPLIRSADAPDWMADGDDRADCGLCSARNGHYCTALGEPHRRPWAHPVGILHWCSEFRQRGGR